jgi:alanine racemase
VADQLAAAGDDGPLTGSVRALARVNLAALERNSARMLSELPAGCRLCAVVKADGYGHGAVPSARAALAGGASWLAVADERELHELREAGLTDVRVLVMGVLEDAELAQALAAEGEVLVWSEAQVAAVAAAGGGRVHVKLDTGMGRLGTRDEHAAARAAEAALQTPGVELAGVMTHFATADERDDGGFFERQLETFERFSGALRERAPQLVVHAANSAAALRDRRAHFDMVRCGIALYGMDPFGEDPSARGLEPALELLTRVAEVKPFAAGDSAGYGRRFIAARPTSVGVLPIGYGDGWRRSLSNNAQALIGGRRYPLVGTVSMDSVTVDLGPLTRQQALELRGEEAILIGARGGERITAEDLARELGTINYEITCGLTPRVVRRHHRDGARLQPVGER